MKILFDQGTPVPIRRFLEGHEIRTAAEERWETLRNGDLLEAAETAGFNLLLTTTRICIISRTLRAAGLRLLCWESSNGQSCARMRS